MTRRGFTLVEVMVALVVSALIALTAHEVFRSGIDAVRSFVQVRRSLDREGNVHRFLTAAFLSIDVGTAGQTAFEGTADRVRFVTRLETPDGWFESVTMDLRVTGDTLIAQVDPGDPLILADHVTAVRFDYLMAQGADEAWIAQWRSSLSVPIGVRVRVYRRGADSAVESDTTLFQIKERR